MKLVIADSSELILEGLKKIFEESDIEITLIARDSSELMESQSLQDCDVLLIDFVSNGFSIDSIAHAQKIMKSPNILAITNEQTALIITSALKAGVKSYVKKCCSLQEIRDAVSSTSKGEAFFCGQIVETIQAESIDVQDFNPDHFSCEPIKLSVREIEVIKLISEGYTNSQIADKLYLSSHTINTHRKNIMAKLGVNNTAAIVMYAVKSKIISPNRFLFNAT
ncbi:MAG: DNA-binding response regulator [Flavobacteriales bacterium]